ncbi:MAG TPA: hemerythrin domain-containing protein, partial [Nakamurella sp.]
MTAQLQLPGQAAAPDGPIDLSTMYVMHFGFRRDLDEFAASAGTPVGDRARWQALRTRWAKFAMILEHHHTVEDEALWPRLLELAREAGDEAAVATLETMEAE